MKPSGIRPSSGDDTCDRLPWYSLIERRRDGRPGLEILRDGRPLTDGPSGQPFLLNPDQARMLLTALREIRQFLSSGGALPISEHPLMTRSRIWQCECAIECQGGDGQGPPRLGIVSGNDRLDLGLEHARAVLFLEAEIEYFVFAHF